MSKLILDARLPVIRDGIMDVRASPVVEKMGSQTLAIRTSEYIEMVNITAVRRGWCDDLGVVDHLFIFRGEFPALLVPCIQMRKLHPQNRGLQLIQAAIPASIQG